MTYTRTVASSYFALSPVASGYAVGGVIATQVWRTPLQISPNQVAWTILSPSVQGVGIVYEDIASTPKRNPNGYRARQRKARTTRPE